MNILRRTLVLPVLALGLAASAQATLLTLNMSGSFGPTSTLDAIAFGAETPFTLQAEFDTSAPAIPPGFGMPINRYPLTGLDITIQGYGTYVGTPAALSDLMAAFADPNFAANGFYIVGLTSSSDGGLTPDFASVTPVFNVNAPGPAVFSGGTAQLAALPIAIELDGLAGGLVINDLGGQALTASVVAASVPEGGQMAMTCLGLLGLGAMVRWQQRCPSARA